MGISFLQGLGAVAGGAAPPLNRALDRQKQQRQFDQLFGLREDQLEERKNTNAGNLALNKQQVENQASQFELTHESREKARAATAQYQQNNLALQRRMNSVKIKEKALNMMRVADSVGGDLQKRYLEAAFTEFGLDSKDPATKNAIDLYQKADAETKAGIAHYIQTGEWENESDIVAAMNSSQGLEAIAKARNELEEGAAGGDQEKAISEVLQNTVVPPMVTPQGEVAILRNREAMLGELPQTTRVQAASREATDRMNELLESTQAGPIAASKAESLQKVADKRPVPQSERNLLKLPPGTFQTEGELRELNLNLPQDFGERQKFLKDIRQSVVYTENAQRLANNIYGLLAKHKEAAVPGSAAGWVALKLTNFVAGMRGIAQIAENTAGAALGDRILEGSYAKELAKRPEFQDLAEANATVFSNMIELAYGIAGIAEGGKLSTSDVESRMRALGEGIDDPVKMSNIIKGMMHSAMLKQRKRLEVELGWAPGTPHPKVPISGMTQEWLDTLNTDMLTPEELRASGARWDELQGE